MRRRLRINRESITSWLPLAAVVAAGLPLRCSHLADRPIWFDEACSWRLVSFSWGEMFHGIALDAHLPLYFVLLKLWSALFGDGTTALRSFSVFCAEGAIVGLYLFVSEAYAAADRLLPPIGKRGDRAAFVAAILAAFSTTQIRWSWEMRMYSLASLLVCFSSLFLVRALQGRVRYWYAYSITAALLLYTHPYAVFSVVAQALILIGFLLAAHARGSGVAPRRVWSHGLSAFALMAALCLPWLPVYLPQTARVHADFWSGALSARTVQDALVDVFIGWRPATPPGAAVAVAVLCALVLGALCIKRTWPDYLVVASALVPFLLAIIVSAWWRNVLAGRYLLFAQLFVFAAIGRLTAEIPSRVGRGLFAAALVVGLLVIHYDFCRHMDLRQRPGTRGVAEYLRRNRAPAQPVIVDSSFLYLPVLFYVRDCRLLDDGSAIAYYRGMPQLKASDFISLEEMRSLTARKAWLVTHGDGSFVKPPHWREIRRDFFAEPFRGGIQVVEFRATAREAKSRALK